MTWKIWYERMGFTPEEVEFHRNCDKVRFKIRKRVEEYVNNNGITAIKDEWKLTHAIVATYPQPVDFVYYTVTFTSVWEQKGRLLRRRSNEHKGRAS